MESCEQRVSWNKGKLVGQKAPLKPKEIWTIRINLQNDHQVRDLADYAAIVADSAGEAAVEPAVAVAGG